MGRGSTRYSEGRRGCLYQIQLRGQSSPLRVPLFLPSLLDDADSSKDLLWVHFWHWVEEVPSFCGGDNTFHSTSRSSAWAELLVVLPLWPGRPMASTLLPQRERYRPIATSSIHRLRQRYRCGKHVTGNSCLPTRFHSKERSLPRWPGHRTASGLPGGPAPNRSSGCMKRRVKLHLLTPWCARFFTGRICQQANSSSPFPQMAGGSLQAVNIVGDSPSTGSTTMEPQVGTMTRLMIGGGILQRWPGLQIVCVWRLGYQT